MAAATAAPVQEGTYLDEESMRYLTLEKGEFGVTRVKVRFAYDPGSNGRWEGHGQLNDKSLLFARTVGEGEERGTWFVAEVSESKVEVEYKPGQKEPQDAGILGTYRRVNDSKMLQLARKEFQAANERLITTLKEAGKTWATKDKSALGVWKDQWPALRQKWMDIAWQPPGQAAATPAPPAPAPAARPPVGRPAADAADKDKDKPAGYWLKLAEATAMGYYFLGTQPDPKTGLEWDGEYDDFAGGHASLRLQKDGRLRVNLTFTRAGDTQTGDIQAVAPLSALKKGKGGEWVAEFVYEDSEVTDPAKRARIKLTKHGRYLQVETQQAERYGARGWFDGIYRGSPVPMEQ